MIYKYNDDDGEHIITDEEILEKYFEEWKEKMNRRDKRDYISEQNCISDWVTSHWAWEFPNPDEVK